MIPGFITRLVREVRTVVHAPVVQAAVLAVIGRFLLFVDVLTGMHRPRPARQQTGTGSGSPVPSTIRNFSPDLMRKFIFLMDVLVLPG
jgi:hypothetical protein